MRLAALVGALAVLAAACSASAGTTTAPTRTVPATPATTVAPPPPATTVPASTIPPPNTTLPPPVRVPLAPEPDPAPPPPDLPSGATGVAVAAAGGAALAAEPGGEPFVVAHEGLVFPVAARAGDWLRVRTPCETTAWLDGVGVAFVPGRAERQEPGPGFDFGGAVIVLDPGHGGPNEGARGPSGLLEKFVNLDIARRARDLLAAPRSIDPATGAVLPGDDIPAAGRVWLTRAEGPPGADVEAGLTFRAEIANRANADAFVSIHNNAAPDGSFDGPGSEVYYRFLDPESRRLAGLLVEELRFGLGRFDAAWVGDTDAGAKYRVLADGVTDLYGVLRRSQVPAALAEGAFISNPPEEVLLGTADFRHAYAEAVYRALVRFLTTADPGSGFTEPYPRESSPGRGAPQEECSIPAQP